jgi:hypothetical protein
VDHVEVTEDEEVLEDQVEMEGTAEMEEAEGTAEILLYVLFFSPCLSHFLFLASLASSLPSLPLALLSLASPSPLPRLSLLPLYLSCAIFFLTLDRSRVPIPD